MKNAFLFPGQGSQSLGMMKGFADNASVRQTFEEAASVLGIDFWAMCAEDGDSSAINATINTQPLMLTAGLAVFRAWRAAGGAVPAFAAGHSLGEYTALTAAGAIGFADALRLVRLRAEAMQTAVPEGQGAMAAILGLDDDVIIAACAEAAAGDVVEAVNFNSPGQVVIAGSRAAVERAIEIMKARGAKRALPLPVSVPSHCALMKPAAEQLAAALASVNVSAPEFAVVHNADGSCHTAAARIREALVQQLYSPVRWVESVRYLRAQGVERMVECGPGKVLAGLVKRIDGEAVNVSLTDMAAIEALLA